MSKTILNVEGMSCPSCIRHVSHALAMRGVAEVDVQLEKGRVVIEHDPKINADRLIAALEGIGYPAMQARPSCGCSATPARQFCACAASTTPSCCCSA